MMTTVTVTLNGKPYDVRPGTTVADLIAGMGREPAGLAVAVNEEVILRGAWSETALQAGDRIEIVTAAQGG